MPRYEFTEGTSNKFWEIEKDGTDVTTRWGRIGTDGQSKTKSYDDEEKAQKEYDKIVKAKTKKGYKLVEEAASPAADAPAASSGGADYQADWKRITEASDLPKAFEEHFAPLAVTDECKGILKDIAAKVTGVRMTEKNLIFEFGDGELSCSPPANESEITSLPATYQAALRVHNGMSYPDDGGWASNFNGVYGGSPGTGFDTEYWEEGENDPDIDPDALMCPIDNYSDWVLFHPKQKTEQNEPALAFFSHEDCELADPNSKNFGAGGFFLRLVGNGVLEDDPRCEEYCS